MWMLFKQCSNNLFQEQNFHMYIYGCLCYSFFDVPTKQHMQLASELWQQWHTWPWWGRLWRWGRSGRSFPKPGKHQKVRENLEKLDTDGNIVTLTDTSRGLPESCCDISLARFKDWTKKLAGSMLPYLIRLGATWNQNHVIDNDKSKDCNFQLYLQKCFILLLNY